jgi:murein DD-endopeptidase MepM/ murein hydrolase activator NlpD
MLKSPLKINFTLTQDFNDKRFRYLYTPIGLMGHNGLDYGTPVGTPVYAPISGTALETDFFDANGYGHYIKIQNSKEGVVLAHFRERSPIKPNTKVKQGDLIGYTGNTGFSTGPHLHFGYWREPRKRDNGFNGFIDPTYWFNIDTEGGKTKLDELSKQFDELKIDHKIALDYIEKLLTSLKRIREEVAKHLK